MEILTGLLLILVTLAVTGIVFAAVIAGIVALGKGFDRVFGKTPGHTISPPLRFSDSPSPTIVTTRPDQTPYVLKRAPAAPGDHGLITMAKPTKRAFTNADELHAATSRQRLWIQYEDYNGNESEREVDVYCPRADDPYIFTWCHLKGEPRTFKRENISAWQFLDGRYTVNPLVEQFWNEEGGRNPKDTIPWKRWLEIKGRHS